MNSWSIFEFGSNPTSVLGVNAIAVSVGNILGDLDFIKICYAHLTIS